MKTLFVANRGEIAARIGRSGRQRGYRIAVAYPPVDAHLPYVLDADLAVELATPRSFTSVAEMSAAARRVEADLVHPGYGFLSESPEFARVIRAAGMVFVGPSASAIAQLGDKARARELAEQCGVPTVPGSSRPVESFENVEEVAASIGYPVMIKAVAGGGGIGMAVAASETELNDAFTRVSSRAQAVFNDPRLIVERFIPRSRHIESQILGLASGEVLVFAERDCSVQRRHQKVVEESPSPALRPFEREQIAAAAVALATAARYENAGTVEFIYDLDRREFFFLEMNTRLQVEHGITEAVHGVDLVALQLDIASGTVSSSQPIVSEPIGHAIEMRVYAEDSERFLPRPGLITRWAMPSGDGIRVDAGYKEGNEVTTFFDPLMAKLIVHSSSREEAIDLGQRALESTAIDGPGANLAFLGRVLASAAFCAGDYTTGLVGAGAQQK